VVGALVAVLLAAALAVHATVGAGTAWRHLSDRWRLDVGAPAATWPYPDDIGTPEVRLAVAGDAGTGGGAARATGRAMDAVEGGREFDALLLLGDNIYPDGDPAELHHKLLVPFAGVLDGSTQIMAALGNHDVRTGDGVPQLEALGLPGRWYERRFGAVSVIVVDSTRADDPEQLAWLDETLATTDAVWTVVLQHHPPHSAGSHGDHGPSRDHLVPRYERHGVDLVLSGHDHDYQRMAPVEGVTYVVSGGAAKIRRTGRDHRTVVAASTHHFVELAVHDLHVTLRAVDRDGRVFDEVDLPIG